MLKQPSLKEFLQMFILFEDASVEELANAIGVSPRTIFNIFEDKNVTDDIKQKCYSFLYRYNGSINKATIEFNQDIFEGKLLYHGSKDGVLSPTKDVSRDKCDFGNGFYLSDNYDQAVDFVCAYPNSAIYGFEFLKEKDLNIVTLDCDLDWMISICYYRGKLKEYENSKELKRALKITQDADVIICPIADNRMIQIITNFADGKITSEQAKYSLRALNLGNQYVFKTDKALKCLRHINSFYLCEVEKAEHISKVKERVNATRKHVEDTIKKYRRDGKYIDEVFK
ncbi:MAG: DUF3990 domain-containing protein [Bacilli bacterium]|nr:DUF3990 domain-containing protein [Bacilli bacterium]